jgi:cytochrome c oxidase subunit 2
VGLHFGAPQIVIGVVFAVIAAFFAVAFVVIGRQAGTEVSVERVHRVGYFLRTRWLALLIAIGVVVVGLSFVDLPYARGDGAGRTAISVTGSQFYWLISPTRVPLGAHVRFDVTSADVNHGFGLYDPRGRLIGSVQAMPGYHNRLDLTLDQPGVYRIRCLELCGLYHSAMESELRVGRS